MYKFNGEHLHLSSETRTGGWKLANYPFHTSKKPSDILFKLLLVYISVQYTNTYMYILLNDVIGSGSRAEPGWRDMGTNPTYLLMID